MALICRTVYIYVHEYKYILGGSKKDICIYMSTFLKYIYTYTPTGNVTKAIVIRWVFFSVFFLFFHFKQRPRYFHLFLMHRKFLICEAIYIYGCNRDGHKQVYFIHITVDLFFFFCICGWKLVGTRVCRRECIRGKLTN